MEGDNSDSSSSKWPIIAAITGVAAAGVLGFVYYSWSSQEERRTRPPTEKKFVQVESPTPKDGPIAKSVVPHVEHETALMTRPSRSEHLPLEFEDYKIGLSKLHQCWCGKSAGDGFALSRCAGCKATYYCCADHQKQTWNTHRTFCPSVNIVLAQGFPGIASYMVRFNPQNVHNINLTQAIEGWSIICTALERKVFANAYEEAKMVHWAGTVHAILSGQKMRAQKEVSGMAMLLKLFAPAMNFFENVLAVSEHSDQRAEVAPFANFELFGMWSSLGLALKDQHPQKMEKMLLDSANFYGTPAIEDLLGLILQNNPNVDQNVCLANLQQWSQSVITIQTQVFATFDKAEEVVKMIEESAHQAEDSGILEGNVVAGLAEMSLFARLLYESAVVAHAQVTEQTNLKDEDWRPEHTELYQKVRQATLQNMMRNAFPELAQELQDQQQLAK